MSKEPKKFKPGTVVVWDHSNFNRKWWDKLPEEDRKKYYEVLGYGREKPVFFVFLCEIINAPAHCVLVNMDNQKVETMRHTSEFREVTEDEF